MTNQSFGQIIGKSDAVRRVLLQAVQVADTDTTVLLLGETGTGKELLARAIHDASRRKGRLLVKVDCAALPSTLVESELFGHQRGAFTGAVVSRAGRFELADGGTLQLDEVGELPRDLQPKLLRVLQEREFERVGSSHTTRVDVRVIAATNRDLEPAVRAGEFRADLFYRLNVFPIVLPPLRERREDIPLLAAGFIHELARQLGKSIETIPAETVRRLQAYDWPGNVRELRNVIERAVIVSGGPALALAEELGRPGPATSGEWAEPVPATATAGPRRLVDVERDEIVRTLQRTCWRIEGPQGAAGLLGLNPSTLRTRMRKLGIARPRLHA